MRQITYAVIHTAQDGVDELDRLRREAGLSQTEISERADIPDKGQQYYRMYKRKDAKVSTFLKLLRATGHDLMIIKKE